METDYLGQTEEVGKKIGGFDEFGNPMEDVEALVPEGEEAGAGAVAELDLDTDFF